jgi:hypothetical protein
MKVHVKIKDKSGLDRIEVDAIFTDEKVLNNFLKTVKHKYGGVRGYPPSYYKSVYSSNSWKNHGDISITLKTIEE